MHLYWVYLRPPRCSILHLFGGDGAVSLLGGGPTRGAGNSNTGERCADTPKFLRLFSSNVEKIVADNAVFRFSTAWSNSGDIRDQRLELLHSVAKNHISWVFPDKSVYNSHASIKISHYDAQFVDSTDS